MAVNVDIKAGETAASSRISASGSEYHVISDVERNTFKVTDAPLKSAVERYFGRRPNDAYVKSPTPWGDLYRTYGWQEVTTNLTVQRAEIIGISSQPVIVANKILRNNSSVPADFDAGISQQVSNTVSSSWSTGGSFTVGQKFTYKVEFLGTGGGGETSLSYTQSWGVSETKTHTVTVGSTSGVRVRLEPGQAVRVNLTASRGTLRTRVTYRGSLTGRTAVNYNPAYQGHHFWGLSIGAVLGSGALNPISTEDITVGFYANDIIELVDIVTGEVIATYGGDVSPGPSGDEYESFPNLSSEVPPEPVELEGGSPSPES
ncbi:ETX/MTX2 family pore-forming toxin [Streptomyces gamaensis]|uniref:ETX/MTX2 family pore-forming toxin n=1 Tax=Streptomyces gamaensis TaxID=1763542 RepID=A0ABW0Z6Z1_9ACTN